MVQVGTLQLDENTMNSVGLQVGPRMPCSPLTSVFSLQSWQNSRRDSQPMQFHVLALGDRTGATLLSKCAMADAIIMKRGRELC
jgi:hypothetical protein